MVSFRVKVLVTYVFLSNGIFRYRRERGVGMGGGGGQGGHVPRLWRIVLLKVAYYATSSARNFTKSCQNYARIPKLCS